MSRQERLTKLVDLIIDKGSMRVDQIVEELNISPATARRDLDTLADQQLITRTRGGAMANTTSGDLPLRFRTVRQHREKATIAQRAAELVKPGDILAFNGGTTTTSAAYEIGIKVAKESGFSKQGITVVTNAVNIANDLIVRPQIRVVVTGGVARTRSYELIGPLSSLILPEIRIDTLFLGVNSIDLSAGFYTDNEGEAAVNAALVKAAQNTVVLADSSKFNTGAFAKICGWDQIQAIVTDAEVSAETIATIRSRGVEVILA